jgi:hypothetical protein
VIRRGASGTFYDKGLEGASHHAVIPNVNAIDKLPEIWPRLSSDEKKLFDVIARAYIAALMPDFRCRQTTATLDVCGFEFRATGRQPIDLGWRKVGAGPLNPDRSAMILGEGYGQCVGRSKDPITSIVNQPACGTVCPHVPRRLWRRRIRRRT